MPDFIPYGRQDISQQDIDAVIEVLSSDFLTQGPQIPRFEQELCRISGAEYSLAVNSATSALHIACLALGVGPGDVVWTSPITFVATANAARFCGAEVDFVDIGADSFNMSVAALEAKLLLAEAKGSLPKVVIPVHMCGQSCDMQNIRQLGDRFGFSIIEDASHAIGGSYKGQPVGGCQYSDIVVFSFHPVKIVTTGEGGAALTNSRELASRMELYRSHGVTRDQSMMTGPSEGSWYYQQIELGYNYRMTEIQAALGISQLARLEQFVANRIRLADRYDCLLDGLPLKLPGRSCETSSAWHLYVIRLHDQLTDRHAEIFAGLREHKIGVNLHYIPVHMQPYYKALGFSFGDFPIAEDYYRRAISIPLFQQMTEAQQDRVAQVLRESIG